jgi:hypothetical protein
VRINGVNWSTTNLNTTRFNNGDEIFHATNYTSWENACTNGIPAWRYLNYDEKNEKLHGKEYNREVISILSKNKLKNVLPENTELLDDLDIEFLINQYNKPDKRKELLSQKGWGSETKVMDCENCQKWTVEYRKKVPCHICKDSRKGETVQVDFNGNNKTGWNIFPSFDGYRRFDTYYGNGKVLLISPNDIYSHWWKESESAGYSIRFKEITQAKKKKNEVIESFESYLNNKDFIKADSVLSEIKGKNYLDKDSKLLEQMTEKFIDLMANETVYQLNNGDISKLSFLVEFFKSKITKSEWSSDGLDNIIKKCENGINVLNKYKELKSKPLTPIENIFLGKWEFESDYVFLNNGVTIIMEENWVVNSDRTYNYEAKYRKSNENNYFKIYNEKGMFEITNDANDNLFVNAYINNEDSVTVYRIDKMKFEEITDKKAKRIVNDPSAKYPIKLKGKK